MGTVTVGEAFGRLTAVSALGANKHRNIVWLCRCSCGGEVRVPATKLRTGWTRSCGCLRRETTRAKRLTHGESRRHAESREYRIWKNMKMRCLNPATRNFAEYGGRGITICDRWRDSFEDFLADMGRSNGLQIERKDNNAGYSPENCIWATRKTQCRNTRRSFRITADGATRTAAEWSERTGIPEGAIRRRIQRGWAPERAVTEASRAA